MISGPLHAFLSQDNCELFRLISLNCEYIFIITEIREEKIEIQFLPFILHNKRKVSGPIMYTFLGRKKQRSRKQYSVDRILAEAISAFDFFQYVIHIILEVSRNISPKLCG